MIAYRTYNTYALLTTVLILVLSVLACAAPSWTTVPTTPAPTVVKVMTTPIPRPTTPDNAPTTAEVTALEALHVRVRPGERETVTGYLYNGDSVTLTNKCKDGWAEILWRGSVAWVKARYLSKNKCSASEEE